MSDRLTPAQLADQIDKTPGLDTPCALMLYELAQRGHVVVHPDELPEQKHDMWTTECPTEWHRAGWNACRVHIFGGDDD